MRALQPVTPWMRWWGPRLRLGIALLSAIVAVWGWYDRARLPHLERHGLGWLVGILAVVQAVLRIVAKRMSRSPFWSRPVGEIIGDVRARRLARRRAGAVSALRRSRTAGSDSP